MSIVLDPDLRRGAAHRNMVDHLTGPFGAGARDNEVAIGEGGVATVDWESRYPVLVAALRAPVEAAGYVVTAALPDATTQALEFVGYTEAGAFLPVYVPPVDADTHTAGAFSVTLSAVDESTGAAVPASGLAGLLEVRLIEGLLGRLLYVCSTEKARLRREGRVVAAMRLLDRSRDDALDRLGAELGVPRFIESHEAAGATVLDRESDDDFRRRLRLYRPWLRSSRGRIASVLNGPGADGDANAAGLGELGVSARFAVVDEDDPFAVSMQLVAAGSDAQRLNFVTFARGAYLIWPLTNNAAHNTHKRRFLSRERRAEETALRADLRARFSFTGQAATNPAVAPMLASALVRAAKVRAALGVTAKWPMKRAQDSAGGSRYELGLGVDVTPFTAAQLANMAAKHAAASPSDPEVRALLAAMTPVSPADDPDGAWLLEPCGLRTVFRVDSSTLFLSHFPQFGLVVSGPTPVVAGGFDLIVPGFFGARPSSGDLLLYDRVAGQGQFLGTALNDDTPRQLGLLGGWRTTWSSIVAGRFGHGPSDLLFHERASGQMEFYGVNAGAISLIGKTVNDESWTTIVPLELGKTYTSLFCYDRSRGRARFYATTGTGHLNGLGKATEQMRKGWTDVVAGDFGGSGRLDLFFFDRETNDAQICTTDGYGSLDEIADLGFDASWTHVVRGRFTDSEHDDLLFYDTASGMLELYTALDGGQLRLVQHQEGLPTGWTHVLAGDHNGRYDLFAYDRILGTAAWYTPDQTGAFVRLHLEQGWRKADGTDFSAQYMSAADPASNAALANGVAVAAAAWTAAGNAAFTVSTSATAPTQQTLWSQTIAPSAAVAGVFEAASLPVAPTPAQLVPRLNALPGELVNTLVLPPALAAQVIAGDPAAPAKLRSLATFLRQAGLTSVLPFAATGGRVIFVTGVVSLPDAGVNLAERPATGFRWYVVPISGPGGVVESVGARNVFVPAGEGLSAVVVVGYARAGLTDPYEYRVDLPDSAVLSRREYEYLMNLLELVTPVGIRVNTFAIRKEHVDTNGDGVADPLDPTISRTYRTFRRRRNVGEAARPDQP
jgi:hypothetical protein